MRKVLAIAGSDCSGGAGIQADLKTMTMHGVYGMSVITALTAQNTMGVTDVMLVSGAFLKKQLEAVFSDIVPDAIKIGMLGNKEIIEALADFFEEHSELIEKIPIVLDPVMVSTSGHMLMEADAVEVLKKKLFPWSTLITPNLPETNVLTEKKIETLAQMEQAAAFLSEQYAISVLVKGGHCSDSASDILYEKDKNCSTFSGEILTNPNKHGTGCTLSSAIACNLAKGYTLQESCQQAKRYVEDAIRANLDLGKGSGPLNHMIKMQY